jgi:hypothetical protein
MQVSPRTIRGVCSWEHRPRLGTPSIGVEKFARDLARAFGFESAEELFPPLPDDED